MIEYGQFAFSDVNWEKLAYSAHSLDRILLYIISDSTFIHYRQYWECICVGSSAVVYRKSTKLLCRVQNVQAGKAGSKVNSRPQFLHWRALYQNEVEKWPWNKPSQTWTILYPAYDFCTEQYGKLTNQQNIFFGQSTLCTFLSGSNL